MTSTNYSNHADHSSSSFLTCLHPQRAQALNTFLASDTIVTIIPSFTYQQYNQHTSPNKNFLLTHDSVGPFQAGIETSVPLWIAIHLRKRNLCRLKCPTWMQVDNLKRILRQERQPENHQLLSNELPFRFAEISTAILQACGAGRSAVHAFGGLSGNEEVPQAEVVRVLLEDICMVRMEKIRKSIHMISADYMRERLDDPEITLTVTGMGSMEMAAIQPFLERALEDRLKLVKTGTTASDGSGIGRGESSGSIGNENDRLSSRSAAAAAATAAAASVARRRRRTMVTRRNRNVTTSNESEGVEEQEEQEQDNDEEENEETMVLQDNVGQVHIGNDVGDDDDDDEHDDDDDDDDEHDDDDGLEEPTADVTADETAASTTTTFRSNIRRYRS